MRELLITIGTIICGTALHAQATIHSEMDGDWYDPSTWDCACIPPNSANVIVDHYVFVEGGLGKSGGSLTISPSGYLEAFETVQLGCAFDNQGAMALGDLWLDASTAPFENQGFILCFRLANYRDGLFNSGQFEIQDELFLYADIENGTTGYLNAFAISGSGILENFNGMSFSDYEGAAIRVYNHDTLDIHASVGSTARAIFNTGYLTLYGLTVDTLTNSGEISSATTHIGAHYSGNGSWFVIPQGQDIFIDAGATMTITAPGVLNVSDGDLTVNGVLDGSGCVLVEQATVNNGIITGTIDICDETPTTTSEPIIDVNAGTVTPGVSFCSSQACIVGIGSLEELDRVRVSPNPAHDLVEVTNLERGTTLLILDAQGRELRTAERAEQGRHMLDVSGMANGIYTLVLRRGMNEAAISLVVVH